MFDNDRKDQMLPEFDANILEYLQTAPAKPLHGHLRVGKQDCSQGGSQNEEQFWNRSAESNFSCKGHLWGKHVRKCSHLRKSLLQKRDWRTLVECTLCGAKDVVATIGEGVSKVGFCWAFGSGYMLHRNFHSA